MATVTSFAQTLAVSIAVDSDETMPQETGQALTTALGDLLESCGITSGTAHLNIVETV
jgi:hypothetical protein